MEMEKKVKATGKPKNAAVAVVKIQCTKIDTQKVGS